ncbi:MAG: GNAT family N-acetyltransferase [Tardiphaga sp.]
MTAADLPAVKALADLIHPAFPEDEAVFANRLALHGAGCRALELNDTICGYVLSHPWHDGQPPALNEVLPRDAAPATTFYIHDLALAPAARKSGAAAAVVAMLAAHAAELKLPNMTLVAVNNSVHFWQRLGFRIVIDPALADTLRSYDDDAAFMSRNLPRKENRDETHD